jgi:hypothetical protein
MKQTCTQHNCYYDLDGKPVNTAELEWVETGIDIDGQCCDRYMTGPETSVWLDADMVNEVEVA